MKDKLREKTSKAYRIERLQYQYDTQDHTNRYIDKLFDDIRNHEPKCHHRLKILCPVCREFNHRRTCIMKAIFFVAKDEGLAKEWKGDAA